MDWRDAVVVVLAGVLGMSGGVFGPAGVVAGVVVGAVLGAGWATRSARLAGGDRRARDPSDEES
jgi:hypothetical protein